MSLLASIRQILLTTPPHCRAYAVMLPTSPPPPMMLTFMMYLSGLVRFRRSPVVFLQAFFLPAEYGDARQNRCDNQYPQGAPDEAHGYAERSAILLPVAENPQEHRCQDGGAQERNQHDSEREARAA